jgi:hypothetical protein
MDTSNDIFVIDNIISKDYQKWIESIVIDQPELPWYYRKNAVYKEYTSDKRNVPGHFHFLYEDETKKSPLFDALYPIILNISEKAPQVKWNTLDRMRINLVPKDDSYDYGIPYHMPHVDNFYSDGWNAIYYVNNMRSPDDGDTFIFEQHLTEFTKEECNKIIGDNYFEIKEKITPKRGRLVLFPSKYFHAASFSNTVDRYVININLTYQEIENAGY